MSLLSKTSNMMQFGQHCRPWRIESIHVCVFRTNIILTSCFLCPTSVNNFRECILKHVNLWLIEKVGVNKKSCIMVVWDPLTMTHTYTCKIRDSFGVHRSYHFYLIRNCMTHNYIYILSTNSVQQWSYSVRYDINVIEFRKT